MRKRNFKLMRETLEWLHRLKGDESMRLRSGVRAENYRFFKIFGNGNGESVSGVGDYDEESGSYLIPIHIHGKSLMGGEEFMDIHSSLGISKTAASFVNGFYSTTPLPDYNGTVVIGRKHVKFKENTPYTLALHFKFLTSATKRNIALRFDYSDGTYDAPIIASTLREFKMCFTSDASKTLVAISSNTEKASNIRFFLEGFALLEGAYSDYTEAFEQYQGFKTTVSLASPLRKIDFISDDADLYSGAVTRKIHVFKIDGTSEITKTDTEGIFEIQLPRPMRIGTPIISPFNALSENEDSGLSCDDSGENILIKLSPDITDATECMNYLYENPFEISYVLDTYETESITPLILPEFDEDLTLEFLSSEGPSKSVAEYV